MLFVTQPRACVYVYVCLSARSAVTAAVEGCRVSRGLVMNESVVTSQVQLPLCCLYAACSPIIPQALHVWCICTASERGWVLC